MAPSADPITEINSNNKIDFTKFSNVINGKLVSTSKTRHGINPATKKANWEVPIATPKDVDDAVAAARAAFVKWSKSTIEERKAALEGLGGAIEEHNEEFAKLLTIEQGKPVRNHLPAMIRARNER